MLIYSWKEYQWFHSLHPSIAHKKAESLICTQQRRCQFSKRKRKCCSLVSLQDLTHKPSSPSPVSPASCWLCSHDVKLQLAITPDDSQRSDDSHLVSETSLGQIKPVGFPWIFPAVLRLPPPPFPNLTVYSICFFRDLTLCASDLIGQHDALLDATVSCFQ